MERVAHYLLSVPERVLRSTVALAGGLLRELTDVALPSGFRRTRLYQNLVEGILRYLIEEVGEVKDAYPEAGKLAADFAVRRAAGNGIEFIGILTFRASPVWVMAALADLCGAGRQLIPEIASALQEEGLLEPGATFQSVDQMLDGLERSAGRMASTINMPPLNVAELRQEWTALRSELASIPPRNMPSPELVRKTWQELQSEAAAQKRSVFELSSVMALATLTRLPSNVVWLARCARSAARRGGQVFAGALLEHYRITLKEIRDTGYLAYWTREFRPYLKAAAQQFSPSHESLTERLLKSRRSGQ